MSSAGGWPFDEPVCHALYRCLLDAYDPDEARPLALSVSLQFRLCFDGRPNRVQLWQRLLDAAVKAELDENLMLAVLDDPTRKMCHERVNAWLKWREQAQVPPRHLHVVPEAPPADDPPAPPSLVGAAQTLTDLCDELGPEPSPGLLLLHLPQLREVLREIEGLLEQWRESVLGSTMPVGARIDLVAGITRMLDAQQEAAAALVEVGEPTSGPARRLARAVEALAEIN